MPTKTTRNIKITETGGKTKIAVTPSSKQSVPAKIAARNKRPKVATRALANSDATKYDLQRGLDAKGVTGYTSVGIGTASLAGMIRGKQNPAKSDDNQFGWIRETVNYYNDHLAKQQQLNANPLTSGKSQTTT